LRDSDLLHSEGRFFHLSRQPVNSGLIGDGLSVSGNSIVGAGACDGAPFMDSDFSCNLESE
jgi:hypothetical protein